MSDPRMTLKLTAREVAQLETLLLVAAQAFDQRAVEARRLQLAGLADLVAADASTARALKAAIVAAYAECN